MAGQLSGRWSAKIASSLVTWSVYATGSPAVPPQCASSPTRTCLIAPAWTSLAAPAASPPRLVVTTTLAPLSVSLNIISRGASSGLRWTSLAPALSAAKKQTLCHGVLGSSRAIVDPGP